MYRFLITLFGSAVLFFGAERFADSGGILDAAIAVSGLAIGVASLLR